MSAKIFCMFKLQSLTVAPRPDPLSLSVLAHLSGFTPCHFLPYMLCSTYPDRHCNSLVIWLCVSAYLWCSFLFDYWGIPSHYLKGNSNVTSCLWLCGTTGSDRISSSFVGFTIEQSGHTSVSIQATSYYIYFFKPLVLLQRLCLPSFSSLYPQ